MKNRIYILIIGTILLTGCDNPSFKLFSDKYLFGKQEIVEVKVSNFDLAFFIDGTDKIHNQYAVPSVTIDFISGLVKKIQHNGQGRLWLGYVDNNVSNNQVAYIEILPSPLPIEKITKKRSETKCEFQAKMDELTIQFRRDSIEVVTTNSLRLRQFQNEAQSIIRIAYSNKVANVKAGSDIHGAINTSSRLFNSIPVDSNSKQIIVLVSDGVDNIGNTLNKIPDNVKVLLVNNSGSKSNLETEVIELDNLTRMEEYIFSDN